MIIIYYQIQKIIKFIEKHKNTDDKEMIMSFFSILEQTAQKLSADDFEIMYNLRDPEEIYHRHISSYCPLFICTLGKDGIALCTPEQTFRFNVEKIRTVSTIGAGDNFNAGFIYGLIRHHVCRHELPRLTATQWESLIDC